MNKEEIIRLFELLEKLNHHFHQKDNYSDVEKSEKIASMLYPEIREFYYDIVWNLLPQEYKKKIEEI